MRFKTLLQVVFAGMVMTSSLANPVFANGSETVDVKSVEIFETETTIIQKEEKVVNKTTSSTGMTGTQNLQSLYTTILVLTFFGLFISIFHEIKKTFDL